MDGGVAPLMRAAFLGKISLVQDLLRDGADVNESDPRGRTPLLWAAIGGRADAVRLLLNRGANPDKADMSGTTALMYAASVRSLESVTLLVNAGSDPTQENFAGETAVTLAQRRWLELRLVRWSRHVTLFLPRVFSRMNECEALLVAASPQTSRIP